MLITDTRFVVCPQTHAPLHYQGTNLEQVLMDGVLVCAQTGEAWPVDQGNARLYRSAPAARGLAALLTEDLPLLHDLAVGRLLPRLTGGWGDRRLADAALDALDLGGLRPRADGGPVRILEVGIGTGLRVEALLSRLPDGLNLEYWGLDLSAGLLARARLRREASVAQKASVRLLLARSDALPFPDGGFDRAWSVGGLSRLGEPSAALAELARVVRGGAPIPIVEPRPSSRIGRLLDAPEGAPALPAGLVVQSEANLGPAFALTVYRRR